MAVIVDDPACISKQATHGEVAKPPYPTEGPPQLAGLAFGSLISIGSAEGDATGVGESHSCHGPGTRAQSIALYSRGHGHGSRGCATSINLDVPGGHTASPGRYGSAGGSHCVQSRSTKQQSSWAVGGVGEAGEPGFFNDARDVRAFRWMNCG